MALRLAMLRVNAQRKAFHKFFDIQFHPIERRWYAWYYAAVETSDIEDMSRGGDDG